MQAHEEGGQAGIGMAVARRGGQAAESMGRMLYLGASVFLRVVVRVLDGDLFFVAADF